VWSESLKEPVQWLNRELWNIEDIMKQRTYQLAEESGAQGPVPQENPALAPPELPEGEGHGYRFRGFGADLALEMCRKDLSRRGGHMVDEVAGVMRQSQGSAVAHAFALGSDGKFFWRSSNGA
jgi:hypothetical protein